jgi:hypothetical protein
LRDIEHRVAEGGIESIRSQLTDAISARYMLDAESA